MFFNDLVAYSIEGDLNTDFHIGKLSGLVFDVKAQDNKIVFSGDFIIVVYRNSYIKYSLVNEGTAIQTVHSVLINGVENKHINLHNTWNTSWIDGKNIPSQDLYTW